MAVSIYARFPLMRSGSLGGDILQREPIKASTATNLLRGVQRAYVGENLRQFVDHAPVWGTITAAGAYEMVSRVSAEFGQARKTVRVGIDSEDCDWQVEIYNAARTVLLAGPLTATSVGRSIDVGTMTLASTHQEVLIEVSIQRGGAPATGTLWSAHVCEKDVVLVDLLLNFQGIDEAATLADQSMSTALLQDFSTSLDQCWEQRTQASSLAYDRRNIRRVVAFERAVWPMLIRLEPGDTEVTVRLRHQVYDQSFTYGASIVRLQQTTGYSPPADVVSELVLVTGGEVSTDLVVPVGPAEGEEIAVLFLSAKSAQGIYVAVAGSASGTPVGHLAGWNDTSIHFNAVSGGAAGVDGVPTFALELQSYVTAAGIGTAAHDPAIHPPPRQIIRSYDSLLQLHIVGPKADAGPGTARTGGGIEDVAFLIPLGYSDLSSVEVRVTGTSTPHDIGGRYNAGAPTSAGSGLSLVRRAEQIFSQRVRVHGYAGVGEVEGDQVDGTVPGLAWYGAGAASGAGEAPVDPCWMRIGLLSSWRDTCAWHVGFDSPLEDLEGTTYRRTGVQAHILLAVTTNGSNHQDYFIRARLRAERCGDLTQDVEGKTVSGSVLSHYRAKALGNHADPVGYLMGYFDWETGLPGGAWGSVDPRVHALRGMIPASIWSHTRLLYLTCELQDTDVSQHRRVLLQLATDTVSDPDNVQAAVILSAMLTAIPGTNLARVATLAP